ncbi:MAG TPA: hypothetical protein VEK07_16930 [Polyangiaceae bacterium]|nr:hypothetical protein [Polyangiaceae bacterium]
MRGPRSASISSWLALVASALILSCKPAGSAVNLHRDVDSDPVALLPPGPALVASVDVRALFRVQALVESATQVVRALLPLDDSSGFDGSRDVDRLIVAQYRAPSAEGSCSIEYVVAAIGRLDPERLAAVRTTRDGLPIVSEHYAGFSLQSAGQVSYAALSRRLLLVGTRGGVRRALDRTGARALDRVVKPWVADTIETSGAALSVAADFESAPITTGAVGAIDLSWMGGLRIAHVTGNFQPPGMTLAATLSYADAGQATRGADGLRTLARWVKTVGPLIGDVHLQDLQIASQDHDLHCTFVLDDSTLRTLGVVALRLLPPPGP